MCIQSVRTLKEGDRYDTYIIMLTIVSAGRAKTQVAGSGSVLTILAAEIPDSGVFLCVANNGVPKAAPAEISQTFYLLVRRKSL